METTGRHAAERGMTNQMLTIRAATLSDAGLIQRLIAELAEYEREPEQVRTTADDIARGGFCANPQFRALIGSGMESLWASRCSFTITRRGEALDYILKIFLCVQPFADAE